MEKSTQSFSDTSIDQPFISREEFSEAYVAMIRSNQFVSMKLDMLVEIFKKLDVIPQRFIDLYESESEDIFDEMFKHFEVGAVDDEVDVL